MFKNYDGVKTGWKGVDIKELREDVGDWWGEVDGEKKRKERKSE